jgi:polar amino acid transport system substrate-binding protein
LHTRTPGSLTVGTGAVPDPPWVSTADPAQGQGLEAAVIAELAATLHYPAGRVHWRTGASVDALESGSVDLLIDHLTIPDTPGRELDYSTGYYDLQPAVVARAGNAPPRTVAGLRGLRVGVVDIGDELSTVRAALPDAGSTIVRYPDPDRAIAALRSSDVDVVALPTWQAVAETEAAGSDLVLIGRLPLGSMQPRQLGIAMAAGSPLTACVSAAIDALRVQGDLAELATRWIGTVPTLG